MQARRQEQVSVLQYERDGLRASRERHMAAYSKLVEARDDLAHLALEPVRALDDQIAVIEQTIAEAEAEKEGQKATFPHPTRPPPSTPNSKPLPPDASRRPRAPEP